MEHYKTFSIKLQLFIFIFFFVGYKNYTKFIYSFKKISFIFGKFPKIKINMQKVLHFETEKKENLNNSHKLQNSED